MKIKIGLMGFGNIGRKLYSEILKYENIEVVAISDIGNPKILEYMLKQEFDNSKDVVFDKNHLIFGNKKARILNAINPGEVPWDVFETDFVIDATGKFNSLDQMNMHLDAGAKRVIISNLPNDEIDRLVVFGVNESSISIDDKTISAGSSTMNALSLLLKSLLKYDIDAVNMTTIHSFTSDQSLQDVAGIDFRCSRSASENIIPNSSDVDKWISKLFPNLDNKINSNALNVPVQKGSMLDLSIVFRSKDISIQDVNNLISEKSSLYPSIVGYTEDPIVSSDIIGDPRSFVFDGSSTLKAGENLIKLLAWYDNGHCHATRILDVIQSYTKLEGFNK